MKCLTLLQPWATLVAAGLKRMETRSWATRYRGPVAVHAAARLTPAARLLCQQEPFLTALRRAGIVAPEGLPLGAVLTVAHLTDCRRITAADRPPEPEASFGDYTPGRWAWHLHEIRPLVRPVPARGRLGLWEWMPPPGTLGGVQ